MGKRGRAQQRLRNERKLPQESKAAFKKHTAKPKRIRKSKVSSERHSGV